MVQGNGSQRTRLDWIPLDVFFGDPLPPTPTPTATLTHTPTATPSGWLKTGSYTGNGVDNRSITGIGFQPDVVIVRRSGSQPAIMRTSNMPNDRAKTMGSGAALATNRIQSFVADGFVVGTNANVNANGQTYYYTAMKAGTNVAVGTYTGNGSDDRNITGLSFQPVWVITLGDGQKDYYRPSTLTGDNAYSAEGTGADSDHIQSILSTGFQLGASSEVNESGRAYYYIAFAPTPLVANGTYTGNGSDSRNINGLGFDPDFVWVKRTGEKAVWRTDVVPGDLSLYWLSDAPGADRIQSVIAGGFQVGTHAEVNGSGSTYHYLALAP
jgi:hypothetical protein